jgi:hypothetical protein
VRKINRNEKKHNLTINTFVGFIPWTVYSRTAMNNIKIQNNHYSGSAQHLSTSNCHIIIIIIIIIITEYQTQPRPYTDSLKPTLTEWQQSHRHCTYSYIRYCSGTNTHSLNLLLQWYQHALTLNLLLQWYQHTHTQLATAVVPTHTLNLLLQWYQHTHSTWHCSGTNTHSHSTWYCSGTNKRADPNFVTRCTPL